jgi:hypothetical protein
MPLEANSDFFLFPTIGFSNMADERTWHYIHFSDVW